MLQRYSLPNFVTVNKFKLAHLGFRAVLDPQAEVLYVAFATSPGPQLAQMLVDRDRASATGDIAVYDLKALRDGKSGDGKAIEEGGELKPVATISIKHLIQGVELSSDGKSLYVLMTAGTTKRVSSIVVIDTEKRQEIKEKRKDLPELARDLSKAGDGKNLIIIEEMKAKAKVVPRSVLRYRDVATGAAGHASRWCHTDVAALSSGGRGGVGSAHEPTCWWPCRSGRWSRWARRTDGHGTGRRVWSRRPWSSGWAGWARPKPTGATQFRPAPD